MLQPSELNDEVSTVATAIRNALHASTDPGETEVHSLHTRFVECVDAINDRLRQCDELLRRGLRGEAIQECEVAPNLLDLVAEIDIPEWDAWADYAGQHGTPPQPELLVDVAAALNEAYSEAQPLEELLRLHRLHALARSPLKNRINVLRGIALKDPHNSVWQQDLRSYEAARVNQIDAEYRRWHKERNVRELRDLVKELSSGSWLQPPAPTMVDQVSQAYGQLRAEAARKKLIAIEKEINAAFSEFNVARAKTARDEWHKYAAVANLSTSDELSQSVAPAFDWLDQEYHEQQRLLSYKHALSGLEQALDNESVGKSDLARLFHAVERFDETIPDRLQRRYYERMRSFDLAESRRNRLVIMGMVGLLILLAGSVGAIIFRQIRAGEVEAARVNLSRLVKTKQMAEAQSFYKKLESDRPAIAATTSIQSLYSELQRHVRQEEARQTRFDSHLETTSQLISHPPNWQRIRDAKGELELAEQIATTQQELLRVEEAKRKVQHLRSRLQTAEDSRFRSDLAALKQDIQRLDDFNKNRVSDLIARIDNLRRREHVTFTLKRALPLLIKSVKERAAQQQQLAKKRTAVQRLVELTGNQPSYDQSLANYVATFASDSNRASDFQAIRQDLAMTVSLITEWNKVATEWNGLSMSKPEEFATRGTVLLKKFDASFANFPWHRNAKQLRTFLQSILSRKRNAISTYFKQRPFAMNIVQVEATGQKLYFLGKPEANTGTRITILALTDLADASDTIRRSFSKTKLLKFKSTSEHFAPAPHQALALRVAEILTAKGTFEQQVCQVLAATLGQKEMDPILKCEILKAVVQIAKPGSSILADELQTLETTLGRTGDLSKVNWLSNDDSEVGKKRELAKHFLSQIKQDPKSIYVKRIAPRLQQLASAKPKLPTLTWVGLLLKGASKKWTCQLPKQHQSRSGELVLLVVSSGSSIIKIGSLASGKAKLNTVLPAYALTEGRPVWLVSP